MEQRLVLQEADVPQRKALYMVRPRRWWRLAAFLLTFLVAATGVGLATIPWQQSVTGTGKVTVFAPMERPQNIEAPIPGRLVRWDVRDGQEVARGQIIAVLDDLDSKFLNPRQVQQMERQRGTLVTQRTATEQRIGKLRQQLGFVSDSRTAALPLAGTRVERTRDLVRAAEETVQQSERSRDALRETGIPAAQERVEQAEQNRIAAVEAQKAAQQRYETEKMRRERIGLLFSKSLRSRQDDELAERDLVVAGTETERAGRNVQVAERAVNVAKLDLNKAKFELARAENEVGNRKAALEAARRDTTVGVQDIAKITADTSAPIAALEASIASGEESLGKIAESLSKLEQDLQNLRLRTAQRIVKAPRDGRIVRLMKVGAGATVKAGDALAVLAPTTTDQAVELMISDNDAPLVSVGRPVRLQFSGWPALQFSGWPASAVGTYGGRVAVVDAIDDGKSRYRVVIKPDRERIAAKKDAPWPPSSRLRPGAQAAGWILLDRVSLGWELWRQFNAFPPTVKQPSDAAGGKSPDGKESKDGKDGYDDYDEFKIKVKSP